MFCENCGKKLIRGYQFCIECGTPVPPDIDEEEEGAQQENTAADEQQGSEMPGIQPIGSEEGTLVFCPTCGMRMQKSTEYCEKCGMKLTGNAPSNGGVPLVNSDPLGGDFSGISDNDIAQINDFVNNSGFSGGGITYNNDFGGDGLQGGDIGAFGGGNLNSEIEALNQQFANLNSTASDMPAISAPVREPEPVPEPQPAVPEQEPFARRVDDFSMEAGMPETQFLSESGLPVINGGEMAEPDVPAELEHHLDDINIDVPSPAPAAQTSYFTEPAPEAPAYAEPAAEVPTYTEPETPAYTEPEVPAYTAPAAEEPAAEVPTYTEPETPAYTEPEVPAYTAPATEEPAAEVPTYTEPETPAYTEPEVPAYTAPATEEPAYTEPVTEEPVYTEHIPEEPEYTELVEEVSASAEPEAPVYSEPAAEVPTYTEPETPAFTEPEVPAYTQPETPAESAADIPAYTAPETPAYSEPEIPAYQEPAASAFQQPEAASDKPEDDGVDLGKLIYCRNCGQDMYEKETVCKYCGSPNRWNEKPMRHPVSDGKAKEQKQAVKVFGIFPIPTVIGAGVVVAGVIALIVCTTTAQNKGKENEMVQDNSTTFSTTAPDTSAVEPSQSDDTSAPDVTEPVSEPDVQPIVSEPAAVVETADASMPEDTTVSEPVVSEPDDVSAPEATSVPEHTTATSATTRPPVNTAGSSATTRPAVTTTTRPAVTTAAPAVSSKPSATVSSEDKQRAKMLDAFETISAEVGKAHVYAQATVYALDDGKTRTFYTSGMANTLSSGKSNAASALKNAKPSSSELTSAYTSLQKLYDLYVDYYTYVTTSTDSSSTYSSKETTKWDAYNNAVKNSFNYSKLQTKNQTDADKSRTYAEIMTDASSAASNAVSQFGTVQTAVEKLKSGSYDSEVMSTIYNDKTTAILKAAGYEQIVTNYYSLLNSGTPSAYTSAKSSLSTASSKLDELLGVFTLAGYNDLSGFKSECSSAVKTVNNAISAINKAL